MVEDPYFCITFAYLTLEARLFSGNSFLLIGSEGASGYLGHGSVDIRDRTLLLGGVFGEVHIVAWICLLIRDCLDGEREFKTYFCLVNYILLINRPQFREEPFDPVSDGFNRVFQLLGQVLSDLP